MYPFFYKDQIPSPPKTPSLPSQLRKIESSSLCVHSAKISMTAYSTGVSAPLKKDKRPTNKIVGVYKGIGINNGTLVWQGVDEAFFLRNSSDNRTFIRDKNLIDFI
jgi:hypothetical protein